VRSLFFEVPGKADISQTKLGCGFGAIERIEALCGLNRADATLVVDACERFMRGEEAWAGTLPAPVFRRLKVMTRLPHGEVQWQYFDGRGDHQTPGAHGAGLPPK
jgi:hypothetical protein